MQKNPPGGKRKLSQAAWCREQGLSLASFGYWRRRLAG
ncbi:IS66 family insertion sequence element accessory protein TnpA [Xanthomonas oryzae]